MQVSHEKMRKYEYRVARGIALAQRWHELDPDQEGTPLRFLCPGRDESDAAFQTTQRELLELCAKAPPDAKQMEQLEEATRNVLAK